MLFRVRLPLPASINGNPILLTLPTPKHFLPNPIHQINQFTFSQRVDHSSHYYITLFNQLKSSSSSSSHLFEARKSHALLIVHGFFHPACTDKSLGSKLVSVYVNFGCLQDAFLAFSKLPQKSNVAWNAMLRGLVNAGQFSEAIEFYHLMLKQGVIPDNYTYPLVLKACSCSHVLEEGRRVQETILYHEVYHRMKPNVYVLCAMIDMFAKCGSLRDARKLFEEMPMRDLASWTAMICGTIWNSEWLEALSLFRRMRSEGIRPDSVVIASILPICGRLESVQLGKSLQGCAVRSGLDSDLYVSNALIDMYCKCCDPHDAHRIFFHMSYKDVVSWSTLIAGYSQNCLFQESFELYVRMINMGLTTNAIIVTSVLPALGKLKLLKLGKEIHNYVLKHGLLSDVVVGSALIDMYAHCGSIREAESVFENMSDKDTTLWNSLIVGYNLVGDCESAFFTFRKIWKTEHRPNSITLVSVLPICTKLGALKQGKEIHGYAIKSGLGLIASVGNSLIDMYGKCGYLNIGLKFFNQMMMKNIITYNTIISACGIHGLGKQGLNYYEQMKMEGIRPNKVTFTALLSACSHAGLVERGWLLYNSMINDYGIEPNMEHYSCMVDLLGRAGDLEDAYKFISRMPVIPDADVLGSLLGACRVHNKVELAEQLAKKIIELNPEDAGHYVLLSNLYASNKRWEDMSKVRNMMKDKGLEKKPGNSWIQVGHHIYAFHATSTFHPAFGEMKETLESLLLEMKDEGYMPSPNVT